MDLIGPVVGTALSLAVTYSPEQLVDLAPLLAVQLGLEVRRSEPA
jgi:hypothetical protein